jgi:very-short-patch-repair endonuclease
MSRSDEGGVPLQRGIKGMSPFGGGLKGEDMKADETNNYAYNKKLQPFANRLRKEMTKAEACLWKYVLRARQMKGYQFRRQRPVLNYIADFMCKELKLVIEVDGSTHQWEETAAKDLKKEKYLIEAGFKVLRFTDEEVLRHIEGVREGIAVFVQEIEQSTPSIPRQRGTTEQEP